MKLKSIFPFAKCPSPSGKYKNLSLKTRESLLTSQSFSLVKKARGMAEFGHLSLLLKEGLPYEERILRPSPLLLFSKSSLRSVQKSRIFF